MKVREYVNDKLREPGREKDGGQYEKTFFNTSASAVGSYVLGM
ncbi:hypothetical protein SAMN02745691_01986 [Parasporobacterium paucivorans DSM 15970]|uniref:Uncharacterized protein n=1 Tax=Parasporobacterium paucivorans DSM 15970 TaxID=1122934 RepID=A0A1M6JFS0_9FIRM|nr:hypothetical protein SAMN02745691_01986 [Parasporobacterium paucivorans DSM 15970]